MEPCSSKDAEMICAAACGMHAVCDCFLLLSLDTQTYTHFSYKGSARERFGELGGQRSRAEWLCCGAENRCESLGPPVWLWVWRGSDERGVGFLGQVALNRPFSMTNVWRDGSPALSVGAGLCGARTTALAGTTKCHPWLMLLQSLAVPGPWPPAAGAADELGSFGKAVLSALFCPESSVGVSTDSGSVETWH